MASVTWCLSSLPTLEAREIGDSSGRKRVKSHRRRPGLACVVRNGGNRLCSCSDRLCGWTRSCHTIRHGIRCANRLASVELTVGIQPPPMIGISAIGVLDSPRQEGIIRDFFSHCSRIRSGSFRLQSLYCSEWRATFLHSAFPQKCQASFFLFSEFEERQLMHRGEGICKGNKECLNNAFCLN
jgi:hypothetical protein